uniref:Cation channel sperm associated auxiliary subunit gamma n=1 Tax=Gopherus evgoodei TaxID=1825980 RepID=A0A8C4Y9E6_9SAUR
LPSLQDATKVIRSAHLTGLRPIVTVTFEAPVNTERQKPQELQIEMKGAPYRLQGPCASEEVCRMCWYTPMPMTKRSVVMEVLVKSNGLGLEVDDKRFVMNINGYVKETETGLQSSLGEKVTSLAEMISLDSRSRPIWSTFNQAPVLILGGFQDYKIILVSDSEFADFTAVEVGIDSCWIGSVNCPLDSFSSSIFDAIATESVLLLRQNQLVYYFTGNYSVLFLPVPGSGLWTRVLNNICVSRLNPVHFPHNDSEFVIALGGGVQEGEFFLGTIRGMACGPAHSPRELCWFIPAEDLPLYDLVNYIHLSDFPQRSPISYFILSYVGEFVCVTVSEEIWFSVEGSSVVVRLYPSEPWDMFFSLQLMRGSKDFSFNETFVSLFFNKEGLQQLVYIPDGHGEGKLIKRNFPLHYILDSQYIKFFHPCSFSVMRLEDLPAPQRFTRMEHYCTEPPEVMDRTGFHNNVSLAVYQGLIFQLLWLHADYSRPYADPVHDPTWRWWKNRKQYGYFFYVASNGNSSGGVYVDMEGYTKIYDLQPNNQLPSKIYLDKNNVFSFSVFLSIRSKAQSSKRGESPILLPVPRGSWIRAFLPQLRSPPDQHPANSPHQVTIRDTGQYPEQELSGTKLLKSSMALKVAQRLDCHLGYAMVPIFIGCPPGKRLAFDITRTLKYTTKQNKRYFDCIHKNPELPCFFFNDVFYPFFLIQDMVTGDSGPFMGSYMLRIIGGGPYSESRIRLYSPSEILDYNTPQILVTCSGRRDAVTILKASRQAGHPGPTLMASFPSCRWICEQNSPCYDVVPLDLTAPDYFFLVEVSNRAVDKSTYCDYDLEFVIHIHGLRLSPSRAIAFMKLSRCQPDESPQQQFRDWPYRFLKGTGVLHSHRRGNSTSPPAFPRQISMAVLTGIVFLYVLHQVLGPVIGAGFTRLIQRFEEALAVRTDELRLPTPPCQPSCPPGHG